MKSLVILAAGSVLCLTACNRNEANNEALADNGVAANDMTANDMNASGEAAPAALPTTAQAFIDAAASSDKFEIESSKLAATSAHSAPTPIAFRSC